MMGYRSQVRSLIIGPKEQMDQFILLHSLILNSEALSNTFIGHITRYDIVHDVWDPELKTHTPSTLNVLDLYGDDWKWYDSYSDVQAWQAFTHAAEEFDLATEFLRIGEDDSDIEHHWSGDSPLLSVSRTIIEDMTKINEAPLTL